MKTQSPWISRILALALLGGTAAWVIAGGAPDRPAPEQTAQAQAPLVATQSVTAQTYTQPLMVTGFTRPKAEDTLIFDTGGIVSKVLVQKGQQVEKGDLLAELESSVQKAQVEQAQAQLQLAQDQVTRLEKLTRTGVATQTSLEDAQANLVQAQSEFVRTTDAFEARFLRAPFNGIINDVLVDEGVRVNAGEQAIHIIDRSQVFVDAYLSQKEYQTLDKNQPAQINGTHTAHLSFLSDIANENRTFRAEFLLDENTVLALNTRVNVLAASTPMKASEIDLNTIVIDSDGQTGVMVLENEQARFKPVQVLSSQDTTWVTGLEGTQTIIVSGQNTITDGQTVRTE